MRFAFRLRPLQALALLSLGLLAGPTARAGLVHDYEFKGNLNDSLGGPSLVSLGGTVGSSSYTFGAQQGLSLSNGLASPGTYTIDLSFAFDTLSGYRKFLDFKGLGADAGLYVLSSNLNFYPVVTGSGTPFSPGTFARVDLTRDDVAGLVSGYVNGVQQFQFNDSSTAYATFTSASNIINFFQDDTVTSGRESSSGSVNQIRIFNTALSSTDVAALNNPASVPEPAAALMVASGLALSGLGLRLRARGTRPVA